jgi:hypothetical protein
MRFFAAVSLTLLNLCFAAAGDAQQTPELVAKGFLPPGTEIAQLRKLDPESKQVKSVPAIVTGHVVSAESSDIVFAYMNPAGESYDKSLFIGLLHRRDSAYVKIYEMTYYGRILLVHDALRLLRLPRDSRDSIVLFSGIGASLGGEVQVFRWNDSWGLVNVMPNNGGVHHVSFVEDKEGLSVRLSFEKYPGEKGVQPPSLYRWDGRKFMKVK